MRKSSRVAVAVLFFAAACGLNQEHYDSAHQAREFGAADRGMLPTFVPDSATNVHMVIDHESGRVWVWCDLDRAAESALKSNVRAVEYAVAAAKVIPPPFGFGNFPEWHLAQANRSFCFISGDWHGSVDSSGKCRVTLTSVRKHA